MFMLAISCLTTSNCPDSWTWHSRSYAILLFTASNLASITSHIHRWVLFLLWLHPFILSGVISPLISSSILGTYWPMEFLFQYPIILLFHTVHGVLKGRILNWFAIPFSSGPHSVRSLHLTRPSWVAPGAWLSFIGLDKAVVLVWLDWLVFCEYGQCVCPLMPSCNTYHLTWVSLTLGVGYLFMAAPAKRSHCSLPWTRRISSPPPFLTFNVG